MQNHLFSSVEQVGFLYENLKPNKFFLINNSMPNDDRKVK